MAKAKKDASSLAGRTGDVDMEVAIELTRLRVRIEELLQYSEGSLIETSVLAGETVALRVGDEVFARGEIVTIGEKFGMRVTEMENG